MSKWAALKCLVGAHAWTRWRKLGMHGFDGVEGPRDTLRQVVQRRSCEFCGQAETRPWQGRMRNHSTKEQPK
jgi:hypothetical protein